MRSPRTSAAILVTLGLLIGTLADRTPTRSPQRAGEYQILAGDFHVHAFPGDGALAPWLLRDEARRAGLDVYGVTNHNQLIAARLTRWLMTGSDNPIVIQGQEITNRTYHMIGLGLERTVDADQPAIRAIADVHAQGGVAIAAHPTPRFQGWADDETVAQLDGVEAAHPSIVAQPAYTAFYERARRLKPSIAAIGSSDFHASPALARCRTFVFARERTAAGILEAIRLGRTVAVDQFGHRYGDPALVRQLDRLETNVRTDTHAAWRRIAVSMVWAGILVLLLFA